MHALPQIRHDHRYPENSSLTASPGKIPQLGLQTTVARHPLHPQPQVPYRPKHTRGPRHPPASPPLSLSTNEESFQEIEALPHGLHLLQCQERSVSPLSRHCLRSTRCYAHIRAFQVKCETPFGIGTPCQQCTKADRVCEWPPAREQDLAMTRSSRGQNRSCTMW